jgi:octaprenyl-diphosphate synthase
MPHPSRQLPSDIAGPLAQVDALVAQRLAGADPLIHDIVADAAGYRGKQVRPQLLLQSACLFGRPTERHVTAAAAIELLHTATLVHDDVVDGAKLRRGCPALNVTWGTEIPLMLGDYLFAQSMVLAALLRHHAALIALAVAARDVCEGEMRQLVRTGFFELSEGEYLSIIEAKTASLFAVSCRLGALLFDAPDHLGRSLQEFGRCVGVAFQIVDDCLDLMGDEAAEGKSLGSDLRKGKLTLPGIHLLARADAPCRAEVLRMLNSEDPGAHREELVELMRQHGALQDALAFASRLVELAKAALEPFPRGDARKALCAMADLVVQRAGS